MATGSSSSSLSTPERQHRARHGSPGSASPRHRGEFSSHDEIVAACDWFARADKERSSAEKVLRRELGFHCDDYLKGSDGSFKFRKATTSPTINSPTTAANDEYNPEAEIWLVRKFFAVSAHHSWRQYLLARCVRSCPPGVLLTKTKSVQAVLEAVDEETSEQSVANLALRSLLMNNERNDRRIQAPRDMILLAELGFALEHEKVRFLFLHAL